MADYDIGDAFDAIEEELIASMIRNMKRHRVEESDNEKQWEMWQAKQLESLEEYKRKNRKKYKGTFTEINDSIDKIIRKAYQEGGMEQEIEILKSIKKKYGDNVPNRARRVRDAILSKTPFGSKRKQDYFQVNDKKLDALIHATTSDMTKAESAMLRMADDQYRKIIFNAQVYANSGAGTYEQAVDMATKDFLSAGINCIEYKDGRRVNIKSYAKMAIRTADKRAALYADGELRKKLGISTVITKKRMNACPKCLPFVDKILIDDVWSGGKPEDGPYPLLSKAMEAGFLHPNCKDHISTYIPGITEPPEGSFTKDEVGKVEEAAKWEAKQQYAAYQTEKFRRLANHSLDGENQKKYQNKADRWNDQLQQMNEKENLFYEGIPKTWERLTDTSNIITVNPSGALDNCVNCTIAYEMRKRGFAVVAGEAIKKLKREPFSAWKEPDIIRIEKNADALNMIKADMEKWKDGSRAQISVIWNKKRGTGMVDIGHSFVAEHHNGKIVFLDVQTGKEYNEDIFSRVSDNEVCYCRIDTLEINDLGSTACRKE